jgi:hypothetical protein
VTAMMSTPRLPAELLSLIDAAVIPALRDRFLREHGIAMPRSASDGTWELPAKCSEVESRP